MKVLVLDDRIDALDFITDCLKEAGHDVVSCADIYEADEAWKLGDIKAIVTDLSMVPNGLTANERSINIGAILTGWIWLIYHICGKREHKILRKTVIFSQYIEHATDMVIKHNVFPEIFEKVRKIHKSDDMAYNELINFLHDLEGNNDA